MLFLRPADCNADEVDNRGPAKRSRRAESFEAAADLLGAVRHFKT
jgi:hypothetical protein